jgi:hypothetical protein
MQQQPAARRVRDVLIAMPCRLTCMPTAAAPALRPSCMAVMATLPLLASVPSEKAGDMLGGLPYTPRMCSSEGSGSSWPGGGGAAREAVGLMGLHGR